MLIKGSTIRSIARALTLLNNNRSLRTCPITTLNAFSYGSERQFTDYLKMEEQLLTPIPSGKSRFARVVVPRDYIKPEDIEARLEGEWAGKKLLLAVDPSALIGHNRMFYREHLVSKLDKGGEETNSIFNSANPFVQLNPQQLRFNDSLFLQSDPLVKQFYAQNKHRNGEELDELIAKKIQEIYSNDPDRFRSRLISEYNVPDPYTMLVEAAVYSENPIYFCGLNEFAFRNLLCKYLTVEHLRSAFMESLKFSASQSYKFKCFVERKFGNTELSLEGRYTRHGRQYLYLKYYKFIKKIENGEIRRKIRLINKTNSQEMTEEELQAEQRKEKVSRGGRNRKMVQQKGSVLLAPSHVIETFDEYTIISDLPLYFPQKGPKVSIGLSEMKFNFNKSEGQIVQDNDVDKIEKNAILEVMLGNMWNRPSTAKKFPYLSESYDKLSEIDKQNVKKIYFESLTKYTVAKKVFYKQNINHICSMALSELENLKQQFSSKEEQIEQAIKQAHFRNKKEVDDGESEYKNQGVFSDQNYKDSYEEVPPPLSQYEIMKIKKQKQQKELEDFLSNPRNKKSSDQSKEQPKQQQSQTKTRGRRRKAPVVHEQASSTKNQ